MRREGLEREVSKGREGREARRAWAGRRGWIGLLMLLGALWICAGCRLDRTAGPAAGVTPGPTPTAVQEGRVVAVTDGDTIRVLLDGQEYRVRYIGMDTPEIGGSNGATAQQQNAALVGGKTVRLERDVSETDRYGRLLRYVWAGELMVNAEMVRLGYARAVAYPPDTRYQALLEAQQRDAQAARRGFWAAGSFDSGSRPSAQDDR